MAVSSTDDDFTQEMLDEWQSELDTYISDFEQKLEEEVKKDQ